MIGATPATKPAAEPAEVLAARQHLADVTASVIKGFDAGPKGMPLAAAVEARRQALEDARANGSPQDKLDASAAYNRARRDLDAAHQEALRTSADVVAAQAKLTLAKASADKEKADAEAANAAAAEKGANDPGRPPAAAVTPNDAKVPISGNAKAPIHLLDDVMVLYLQKIQCSAASLAISKGDTLLYERGYGWLDQEHKTAAPENAFFGIASCEKPITAAAVRKLAAEGKLNLDAPLFATLGIRPAGAIIDPRVNHITFEHVLDMKAGWGGDIRDDLAKAAQASGTTPPFTIPVLLSQAMSRRLEADPGKVENYSNFGFDTLRYVVEYESHKQPGVYYREGLLHRSNCDGIGQPEELSPKQQASHAVWNLKDGGPIFASARYLCFFMDEYWETGKPRDRDHPLWVKYGSLPGSTSIMIWRQDGFNVAAAFNGRNETTHDEIRAALEKALDQYVGTRQAR